MKTRNTITLKEILHSGQNPADTLRKLNAQIYPSKVRVELNDKLMKFVFSLTEGGTKRLLGGEVFSVVEKENFKNYGDILTAYKILNAAGYSIQRPLTEFDRDVLSVCISEQEEGNRYTTPSIIYRGLTGKVNRGSDAKPGKDQLAAIIDSIKILMSRRIHFDASDLCRQLNYNDSKPIKVNDSILPAWFVESTTINGNNATVIFFERECPLLKLAKAKKQIITYPTQLLDVPGQQNTFMNISLKNYALRRVLEILAHYMTATLTFGDIFEKCRIEDAKRDKKLDARNNLIKFFEHLKTESVIQDFTVVKKRNAFYSIKFTYVKE